jgi:hypothetical protein
MKESIKEMNKANSEMVHELKQMNQQNMANAIISNTTGAQVKDPSTGALLSSPPANPMKAMTSLSVDQVKAAADVVVEEEEIADWPLDQEDALSIRKACYEFIDAFTNADDKNMAISRFKMPCDHIAKDPKHEKKRQIILTNPLLKQVVPKNRPAVEKFLIEIGF